MQIGGVSRRLVPMLRVLGHCALLACDLPRFAFFGPRPGGDSRNGLAVERDAQVVAALRQLECGDAMAVLRERAGRLLRR